MSVLLDTHYVYAIAGTPGRLSAAERQYLASHDEPFRVSAVSIWEMRLKWKALYISGQRKGPLSPAQALHILSLQPIEFLPLMPVQASAVLQSPLTHDDPFDELLLVQAQTEGLKLLTRDQKLRGHPLVLSL